MIFSLMSLGQPQLEIERFPLILTVGVLKRNDKESLNIVNYFETYWLAFNYSCAFGKTVEPYRYTNILLITVREDKLTIYIF